MDEQERVATVLSIVAAGVITDAAPASVPYDVYGCRLPDGSPAAVEGWTTPGNAPGITTGETC